MTTTVHRWDENARRYLPSLTLVSDDAREREWWHILADERDAERDAEPEPHERRRGVGHPVETEGGGDETA